MPHDHSAPAPGDYPDCCYLDTCLTCGGTGYIITCPDDLCANSDSCMHGDGEQVCPECGGLWEIFGEVEED